MHIKSIKNFPRKASGAATVEFALVAAVVFTLLFGIIDFSYIFWGTLSMQHAVREGARYAVTGQSNLFTNPTGSAKDRCDAAVVEIKNQSMGFYDRVNPVVVFFNNKYR
jgi:Flp pilus assembly protein TadG